MLDPNGHAPIHHLPTELICAIFLFGFGHYDAHDKEARRFIISLSHVCSLWREIALHLSPLWTDITFVSEDLDDVELTKSRASAFLNRSKNALLNFRLAPRDTSEDAAIAVTRLMLPHWHRCQTIKVHLPIPQAARPGPLEALLFPLPGPLNNLMSIIINIPLIFGTLNLFQNEELPKLEELAVDSEAGAMYLPSSPVLSHLKISPNISVLSDPYEVLHRAASTLRDLQINTGRTYPPSPIQLPHLESLAVPLCALLSLPRIVETTQPHALTILPNTVFRPLRAFHETETEFFTPIPSVALLRMQKPMLPDELEMLFAYTNRLQILEIHNSNRDIMHTLSKLVLRNSLPPLLRVIRVFVPFDAIYPNPFAVEAYLRLLSACEGLWIEFMMDESLEHNEAVMKLMYTFPGRFRIMGRR